MKWLAVLALAGCLPDTYESDRTVEWEPPAPSAAEVIDRFQRCMQFSDFMNSFVAEAWAFKSVETGDICSTCHHEFGMFSPDSSQFFFAIDGERENFLLLFGFDPAGDGAVVPNRRNLERIAQGPEHPRFELLPHETDSLGMFTARTYGRIARNDCPP